MVKVWKKTIRIGGIIIFPERKTKISEQKAEIVGVVALRVILKERAVLKCAIFVIVWVTHGRLVTN
jgi:hypothetical protein